MTPRTDSVICPNCVHQFVAIPVDVERELAAAERMVQTFRDWMAGCENETRWKDVEAAHINLRDALRTQSGTKSDKVGRLVMNLEADEPAKFRTPLCCPVRVTCEREGECSAMCAVRCRPGTENQVVRESWHSPDEVPPVKFGTCQYFLIAVERGHAPGKGWVFEAAYLNGMWLGVGDDDRQIESEDEDDEGRVRTTGWFEVKQHADYDEAYYPTLQQGDRLLGWTTKPAWPGDSRTVAGTKQEGG